jgi:hypothetical protein
MSGKLQAKRNQIGEACVQQRKAIKITWLRNTSEAINWNSGVCSMVIFDKVSTGLQGFDQVIDNLRLGDNVVWQVDTASDYKLMVDPYVAQAKKDRRVLVYVRFGSHAPLVDASPDIRIHHVDASKGFENFAIQVNTIVKEAGREAFFVFDCLTDLLKYWHSDLMIGNFFKVTCPFLYELDTVAYFSIIRDAHTFATIAGIRETTQVLLDLYQVVNNKLLFVHPAESMRSAIRQRCFFPHLIQGQEAIGITASAEVAELFPKHSPVRGDRLDYWERYINNAKEALSLDAVSSRNLLKSI